MKKILTIISLAVFLISCSNDLTDKAKTNIAKYEIVVTTGKLYYSYYTTDYQLENGCVKFIDLYGQNMTCCGNFTIYSYYGN